MASKEITKEDMCPFGSDEEGEDNECMITQNGAPSAWTVSTACDTWRALR